MTKQVLIITCDDTDCRQATGGFDYFVTEIRDGLFSSEADFCRAFSKLLRPIRQLPAHTLLYFRNIDRKAFRIF